MAKTDIVFKSRRTGETAMVMPMGEKSGPPFRAWQFARGSVSNVLTLHIAPSFEACAEWLYRNGYWPEHSIDYLRYRYPDVPEFKLRDVMRERRDRILAHKYNSSSFYGHFGERLQ